MVQPRKDTTLRVLKLINHDQQFEWNLNKSPIAPIILNHFNTSDPNFMKELQDNVYADGAGMTFIARCECGETEGNNKIGVICSVCDTPVEPVDLLDDDNLLCQNWIACPEQLPGGWIAPKIYLNLATWLSYGKGRKVKQNYLDDILDVTTPIPADLSDVVDGKGFAWLYDNFDRMMDYFCFTHPTISRKPETAAMLTMIRLNREKVWCHKIPVMNAAINPIVEQESQGANRKRYTDITADHILQAAITLSGLRYGTVRKDHQYQVERKTFKAYKDTILYIESAFSKYVSTKKAIPRTHIFGSRFHMSFRGVVVPIVGVHEVWEIHMPQKMAVNSLRVMIVGRLLAQGYSINDAYTKVRKALVTQDHDVAEILNDLIEETPFPGIAVLWDRPPSIRDGSVQLKYITKVSTNMNENCIGISPLDVALQNCDFDGDALAGIIIPEVEMVRAFANLSPSRQIYNRNTGEISSEIAIHKTLAVTWNAFLGNNLPPMRPVDF